MMNMFNSNGGIDPSLAKVLRSNGIIFNDTFINEENYVMEVDVKKAVYNAFGNGNLLDSMDIDEEREEKNCCVKDVSSEKIKSPTDITGTKEESKIQNIDGEIEEIPNINNQPIDGLRDEKHKFQLGRKRGRKKRNADIDNTTIGQMLLAREAETNILRKLQKIDASGSEEEKLNALKALFDKSDINVYPELKGGKNYERFKGETIKIFFYLTRIMIEKGCIDFVRDLEVAVKFFANRVESIKNNHAKCGIVIAIKYLAKREEKASKGKEKPFMDKLKGMREKYKQHSHNGKVGREHCFVCAIGGQTHIIKKSKTPKTHKVKNVNGFEKEI